jgi:hypothetical protein
MLVLIEFKMKCRTDRLQALSEKVAEAAVCAKSVNFLARAAATSVL